MMNDMSWLNEYSGELEDAWEEVDEFETSTPEIIAPFQYENPFICSEDYI